MPRDRGWIVAPVLVFAFALVAALFAGLLAVADLPGVRDTALTACYLGLFGAALVVVPRRVFGDCEYVVTDRRVLWRRGRWRRTMNRDAITYGRVVWHRSVAGVGHLELVCAVPFGPLARRQRIVLNDVRQPDRVLALIRGAEPSALAGDAEVPLTERLDADERVLWGGHPEGWLLGWREMGTAVIGVGLTLLGLIYGHRTGAILLGLEEVGLQVRSWEWALFFLAVAITATAIVGIGGALVWHGLWRARRLGRDTEYVLTDRRLLIRRGRTELSVERARIVDIAEAPALRGLHHLFLVLDAPESRALAVSGGLGPVLPSRDQVPPVLYELRDVQSLKSLIFTEETPALSDAA